MLDTILQPKPESQLAEAAAKWSGGSITRPEKICSPPRTGSGPKTSFTSLSEMFQQSRTEQSPLPPPGFAKLALKPVERREAKVWEAGLLLILLLPLLLQPQLFLQLPLVFSENGKPFKDVYSTYTVTTGTLCIGPFLLGLEVFELICNIHDNYCSTEVWTKKPVLLFIFGN